MGMAASQARLLCITARIHDVEYQAQAIENAKLQLATKSDQVYNEYLEALDATTLALSCMNSDGTKSSIAATFNNLFSMNRLRPADGSNYALVDEHGRLIVEDKIAQAYNSSKGLDAYHFALAMIHDGNLQEFGTLEDPNLPTKLYQNEIDVYKDLENPSDNLQNYFKKLEEIVNSNPDYKDESSTVLSANIPKNCDEYAEYNKYKNLFRNQLYKEAGFELAKGTSDQGLPYEEEDFDQSLFNRYIDLFKQIESCGGCTPISAYDGSFGDASNNSEWLHAMVQSGQLCIMTVENDKSTGGIKMDMTSPSSDTSLSYVNTSSIDSRAEKKAEAKYEHDMKEIQKKDKQFDLSLSKLETERTALTTEYESVKKVIEDNIDRTFGIFS